MSDISQLIDIGLWKRAGWKGTVFGARQGEPPIMALAFTNGEAGKKIFKGFRSLTGRVDQQELIRVAIIEGDIPGENAGYTIHVGPNIDAMVTAAKSNGKQSDVILTATRILRMNPSPDSPYLSMFKREFEKYLRYSLMSAGLSKSGDVSIDFDQPIGKKLLVLKHESDIGANDIDGAIFAREGRQRLH